MFAFVTSERFNPLEPRDRDRLEALAKLDEFSAGQEISASGTPSDWLYLIAAGGVDVRARTTGEDTTLARLGPGDIFGELESFAELPLGIRHVARTQTIVRAVPKGPLKHELRAHRALAVGLLSVYCRSISEKLRSANEAAARIVPGIPTPPAGATVPPPPGPAARARPSHLQRDEAGWMSLLGQSIEVNSGTAVVEEGDSSRAFYIIEEGELEVRKATRPGAPPRTLATLGAHDLFGFMAFVDGKPRSASVVSIGPSRVSRVDPAALDKALRLNFTVGFKFLGTLCGVLGRTYQDTARRVLAGS